MRIIFVTTNDHVPTGGSEELWSQAALQLAHNGAEIAVCARKWDPMPNHVQVLLDLGCEYFPRIRPRENTFQRQLRRAQDKLGVGEAWQFRRWAHRFKPDLVVFSHGTPYYAYNYMSECINRNLPYVLLIQNVSDHSWPHGTFADCYIRAYSSAQLCFFVAKANRKLVEKQLGIQLERAEVVQNPYKVNFDKGFEWDLPNDRIRLASVANLNCHHKGQDILLEVMRQDKWRDRDVEVDLYGSGINERLIKSLIKNWNIENVNLGGFVDDIEDVWNTHHALVMPSRMEGTPLALVEAQLCGRPAIVTDVGGNAEVVQDGVNGFIAKAPTAALFDEALERAWQRRAEWRDIGRNAHRLAHQKISREPAEDFANRISDVVRSLAER